MNLFDMRTIVFGYVISNTVCLIVMAVLWLQNRNRFAGLGFWLADFAIQFMVILLVALRGMVPDFLSIVVSNSLAIAGTILLYMGLERFVDKRTSQFHNYLLLGIFIFVHSYFAFIQPILLIRTVNLSVGIILICAQCARLLISRVDADIRPMTRGVGYIFLAFCLFSIARIFIDLVVSPGNDFFQSGTFEALAVLINQTLFLILTFGLLLMVNQRLVADLARDIVARMQVEEALRRNEALLLQTGEMAKVGGWELDLQTMTLHWSPETYLIHEVDPSLEPDLENAINYYAPEARPVISEAVRRATEEGQPYDLELPFITAKGNPLWIRTLGQPEFQNGRCVRLFGAFQDITERKQAEENLRRFELLSNHSRDIVLFMRREDGRILEANAAAIQAYGYSRDELLALTIRDLRAPHTLSLTADQMAQADAGGILFETVHLRKDGSAFPAEVSSQGATIDGVRTLVSIVRDITERRRAEEEITSLSKFPMENPFPVLRVQNNGRVIYANAASRELLEMWGCEVDGDLPAELKNLVSLTVERASNKTVDIPCNDKVYSITFVPIRESGYVNLYCSDTTARRRAEQALLESEEKYRLIANNANDWIYWIKPDKSFQYVSPSCERVTGFTFPEFMDNPHLVTDIIHPEDKARAETHLGEVQEGGETHNLDYRIFTKAGEVRWVSHSCDPVYAPDGTYMGRRGTNRDVTERKQAENVLRQTAEELDQRTRELNAILSSVQDYVYIFDPEGHFVFANKRLLDLWGQTAEQAIGKTMRDLNYSEAVETALWESARHVFETGRTVTNITHYTSPTGASGSYENILAPMLGADGRVAFIAGSSRDITERKQAEEKVQRSEAMLRAILEQMPSGVTVRDVHSGELLLSNARSQQIMNMLVDTPAHFSDYRGFHPDCTPYRNEDWPISRSLTTGEVVHGEEINCQRRDETWMTLSINSAPVRDPQGQITMAIGVFDDITKQKQAEEQRAILANRLALATSSAHMGIWDWDIQKNELVWDDQMYALYGLEPGKFGGAYETWLNGVHPDDRDLSNQVSERAVRGEREYDTEFRIIRPDGSIHWLKANGEVFRDELGRPLRMVGVNYDITERKQAEEALRESEERYRSLFENMVSGYAYCQMLFDETNGPSDFIYINVNDKFEKLTGLRDVEGRKVSEVIPGIRESNRELFEIYGRVSSTGEPERFETYVESLDIWFSISVYSPRQGYFVAVFDNITERKRAEQALHGLTEDLRRSNAELEQFAYIASHDLQEPLRMVSSYVQLLARRYHGKLDGDADEFINFAADGAKRMQNLINDLLAYSRVNTRSNPFAPVSTEEILKEAMANLQFLIEENGAEITHEPLPVVKADFTQLVAVFQNLIGNAIKFRGAEPPCLHIEARQVEAEWIFSVCDNGIGIDPKFAERIFVIFQRLNDRTAYPGTGIGLAICKRVIQRHGGRIWVESKPGEGATFYFTLPVKETL